MWDYFWASCLHSPAVTVSDDGGKLAFLLGVINPQREKKKISLGRMRVILHTCKHVCALKRGFRCLSGGI